MPNTLGMSLKISSILHWNMSPTSIALKGKCLHLYLPNWQATWLNMMTAYLILGYGILNSHLLYIIKFQ